MGESPHYKLATRYNWISGYEYLSESKLCLSILKFAGGKVKVLEFTADAPVMEKDDLKYHKSDTQCNIEPRYRSKLVNIKLCNND